MYKSWIDSSCYNDIYFCINERKIIIMKKHFVLLFPKYVILNYTVNLKEINLIYCIIVFYVLYCMNTTRKQIRK